MTTNTESKGSQCEGDMHIFFTDVPSGTTTAENKIPVGKRCVCGRAIYQEVCSYKQFNKGEKL